MSAGLLALAFFLAGPGASSFAQTTPPPRVASTAGTWATASDCPTAAPVASTQGQGQALPSLQVQQARYQAAFPPRAGSTAEDPRNQQYRIQLEPPGLERLAQSVQNDPTLQERIRQETYERSPTERVTFPESPILSRDIYNGRGSIWPARHEVAEPYYVNYERLYFEQRNFERYGWDLGIVSPIVSAGTFFLDVGMFPYNFFKRPCQRIDSNAGLCLPGDPVPFLLYPPELSMTGSVAEVGVILALVAIFP